MTETLEYQRRAVRTVAPVTATTGEVVTIDELKLHLGIPRDVPDEESLLRDCIDAAVEAWEADTGMVCLASTWVEKYDCWPGVVQLSKRPLVSVSSITYLDSSGASAALSSSDYTVDTARVIPAVFWKPLTSLPSLSSSDDVNLVTVTYVAGYSKAATTLPVLIKQAVKLKAGEFYDERGASHERNVPLDALAYERIRAKFERSSYP